MKIKLAILEKDKVYLHRLATSFSEKYADKFEIYSFTDMDMAINAINETKMDVLLASDSFELDLLTIPTKCGIAYLVDSADIDKYNNQMAICRFQKADLIYKQILNIYSEVAGNISSTKVADGECRIIMFSSPCGGVGTSSMAAAAAAHFASLGHRSIYVNFETFGSSDVFFSGEGQFGMSEVIAALKRSNKVNVSGKLESCVRQDASGVWFFAQSEVALNMIEFTTEERINLIEVLKKSGLYDYIIIDSEFSTSKEQIKLMDTAHAIVMVCDGSATANVKLLRAYNTLAKTRNSETNVCICDKMCLAYNKFSNKTGHAVENIGLRSIGGSARFEHASATEVVSALANLDMYDGICE